MAYTSESWYDSLLRIHNIVILFCYTVVAGVMVIAGILHPQEFWDLASGLLYFLTIPSGYLLLTIFMLTNMHNVSWGMLNCHYRKYIFSILWCTDNEILGLCLDEAEASSERSSKHPF